MGTRHFFEDESGSEVDENNSGLPFPKPLHRSAFLESGFEPTTFLANLSDRYQTLEDLRNELRDLSQSLGKELLDLINDNYQDFLSLGGALRGGEEKTEEVRVGLLGFQRDIGSIQDIVVRRRTELATLVDQKKTLIKQIQEGKTIMEIAEQIEDLEAGLMISSSNPAVDGVDHANQEFSEESDEAEGGVSIHRLERHVEQYRILMLLVRLHNPLPSFIVGQAERITRIKSTLSLDLDGALKSNNSSQQDRADSTRNEERLRELMRSISEDQIKDQDAR